MRRWHQPAGQPTGRLQRHDHGTLGGPVSQRRRSDSSALAFLPPGCSPRPRLRLLPGHDLEAQVIFLIASRTHLHGWWVRVFRSHGFRFPQLPRLRQRPALRRAEPWCGGRTRVKLPRAPQAADVGTCGPPARPAVQAIVSPAHAEGHPPATVAPALSPPLPNHDSFRVGTGAHRLGAASHSRASQLARRPHRGTQHGLRRWLRQRPRSQRGPQLAPRLDRAQRSANHILALSARILKLLAPWSESQFCAGTWSSWGRAAGQLGCGREHPASHVGGLTESHEGLGGPPTWLAGSSRPQPSWPAARPQHDQVPAQNWDSLQGARS